MVLMGRRRIKAAKGKQISVAAFQTMNLTGASDQVIATGRNFDNQFQMSVQEYESLLAAANLAAYTKSGFIMKPNEWGIFLGGHHFLLSECNIELDKKKFDIDAMINGTIKI